VVDATVEIVDRGRMETDRNLLVQSAVTSTHSDPDPSSQRTTIPIYSLVVDHPEATVPVDRGHTMRPARATGWGSSSRWEPVGAVHRFDEDLAAAGYDGTDVDAVVVSHLGTARLGKRSRPTRTVEASCSWFRHRSR
jgi:hypothetical protein